jgi:hypothetical protein
MPFIRLTSTASSGSRCTSFARLSRSSCEGTATTTIAAPSRASAASLVANRRFGSGTPGRYAGFSWVVVIVRQSSSRRPHSTTSVPASASTIENAGAPRSGTDHGGPGHTCSPAASNGRDGRVEPVRGVIAVSLAVGADGVDPAGRIAACRHRRATSPPAGLRSSR